MPDKYDDVLKEVNGQAKGITEIKKGLDSVEAGSS